MFTIAVLVRQYTSKLNPDSKRAIPLLSAVNIMSEVILICHGTSGLEIFELGIAFCT